MEHYYVALITIKINKSNSYLYFPLNFALKTSVNKINEGILDLANRQIQRNSNDDRTTKEISQQNFSFVIKNVNKMIFEKINNSQRNKELVSQIRRCKTVYRSDKPEKFKVDD